MSRKRNPENKGLPSRWRFLKNAYYYDVPELYRAKWDNKRLFRLGSTQFEAYKEWALRLERIEIVKDVGDLLDDTHPFIGQVRLARPEPRDRYIEDWEVQEMFTLNCRRKKGSVAMIQAYLRLKMMTGMARGDLLRLTTANFGDSGIPIQRHKTAKKTGKRTIYLWTPDLRLAIDAAIKARPCLSPFLFCNSKGHSYLNEENGRADGFDSMWGRFVDRVLKETKVTRRFTEHDFRAKTASDAESSEHARALLSHVDVNTTNRVYRRKPETVTPLKSVV